MVEHLFSAFDLIGKLRTILNVLRETKASVLIPLCDNPQKKLICKKRKNQYLKQKQQSSFKKNITSYN